MERSAKTMTFSPQLEERFAKMLTVYPEGK
jgi:hypothetical protein